MGVKLRLRRSSIQVDLDRVDFDRPPEQEAEVILPRKPWPSLSHRSRRQRDA